MPNAGGLHSLQQDIERLSSKLQHSINKQPTAEEKQQLAAQCDRLLRCYTALRNSQPQVGGWAWIAEEPPGTIVGNLNQKIAQLEAALAVEQRCSTPADDVCGRRNHSAVCLSASPLVLAMPLPCVSVQNFTSIHGLLMMIALLHLPSCPVQKSVKASQVMIACHPCYVCTCSSAQMQARLHMCSKLLSMVCTGRKLLWQSRYCRGRWSCSRQRLLVASQQKPATPLSRYSCTQISTACKTCFAMGACIRLLSSWTCVWEMS